MKQKKFNFRFFSLLLILFLLLFSGCIDNIFNFVPSIEKLKTGEKEIILNYYLHGQKYSINYTVYEGLNNYLASLPREIYYQYHVPTTKDFIMRNINQEQQKEFLLPLVHKIQNITSSKDDQIRISISIIQNIPYDWVGLNTGYLTGKYPYEVLYTQCGVCGEKSEFLAFLIRELGYGVVIFEYPNHRAVGIKCSNQYDYGETGYCFVETTSPSIITDSSGEYIGIGELPTFYEVILIFDGYSFNSISEEYYDAIIFNQLENEADKSGGFLSEYDYNRWLDIVNKYGIEVEI